RGVRRGLVCRRRRSTRTPWIVGPSSPLGEAERDQDRLRQSVLRILAVTPPEGSWRRLPAHGPGHREDERSSLLFPRARTSAQHTSWAILNGTRSGVPSGWPDGMERVSIHGTRTRGPTSTSWYVLFLGKDETRSRYAPPRRRPSHDTKEPCEYRPPHPRLRLLPDRGRPGARPPDLGGRRPPGVPVDLPQHRRVLGRDPQGAPAQLRGGDGAAGVHRVAPGRPTGGPPAGPGVRGRGPHRNHVRGVRGRPRPRQALSHAPHRRQPGRELA